MLCHPGYPVSHRGCCWRVGVISCTSPVIGSRAAGTNPDISDRGSPEICQLFLFRFSLFSPAENCSSSSTSHTSSCASHRIAQFVSFSASLPSAVQDFTSSKRVSLVPFERKSTRYVTISSRTLRRRIVAQSCANEFFLRLRIILQTSKSSYLGLDELDHCTTSGIS